MNQTDILQKSIDLAFRNGFKRNGFLGYPSVTIIKAFDNKKDNPKMPHPMIVVGSLMYPYEALVFNQDFAKAIWGVEQSINGAKLSSIVKVAALIDKKSLTDRQISSIYSLPSEPLWKYHLAQMVISPNPITYLGKNI